MDGDREGRYTFFVTRKGGNYGLAHISASMVRNCLAHEVRWGFKDVLDITVVRITKDKTVLVTAFGKNF